MSGSPDYRPQRGYVEQNSPRASPHFDSAGLFGVRVQVQGIKGHPYVVLNNGGKDPRAGGGGGGGPESLRDVPVAAHHHHHLEGVRGPPLGGHSGGQRPAQRQGQCGGPSQAEFRDSPRTMAANAMFHYQRHPELLRPYNPDDSNSLADVLSPAQTASALQAGNSDRGLQSNTTQTAAESKARIPLPAEGPGEVQSPDQAQTRTQAARAPGAAPRDQARVTLKSPNSVDTDAITSVGRLIDQFDSPQRRGRCGPRARLAPEERRRSRSAESSVRSSSDPSSSSSSSPAPAARSTRGETPGGVSGVSGGSSRARFFAGDLAPTPAPRRAGSKSATALFRGQREKEAVASPGAVKVLYRVEKTSLSRSTSFKHPDESTEEREAQVTPDLLKGWQQLLPQPNEDTTRQILYTYLQDGTTDNSSTTQRKVSLVFDRINKLKWKTAENVEEEEDKDFAEEMRELQERGAVLEREVSDLKKQLDEETMTERSLAEACEKAKDDMKVLQGELEKSQKELSKLRGRLAEMEAELQSTKQELVQLKAERDKSKIEMKDLQQQLSEMHDELDQAKNMEGERIEDEALLKDMAQLRLHFQEVLQVQEEQEEELHWRERELTAIRGALTQEVETHDKEMAALTEEYDGEIQHLRKALEEAKASNSALGQEKAGAEEQRGAAQGRVDELTQERERLVGQLQELESKVQLLSLAIQESRALEHQLEERTERLEREKQRAEETLIGVKEKEEEMCQTNHALAIHLENVQCELTKLNHEHRELTDRLRAERAAAEALRRERGELEEERRLQDRAVEQLQRKMSDIVEECETSTERLQLQINEAREESFRELTELQKQLQEKGAELEKSQQTARKLQEELSPVEEDLRRCRRSRDEAQERGQQLERRVEELGEWSTTAQDERDRLVKLMEERIGRLEEDLGEERSSADLLMTRVEKGRDQLEKMRSELQQERAVRQDLECDRITLERQNKDLKSRVSHLEGSQRTNQDGLVSRLVVRVQELEDRLLGEERDNSSLQQANRKLERKVKEMTMHADDEHLSLQTQRDQLSQRLKTAKRQMDEAEEEIERLEHAKKKLQRDLDEQVESNEQLQSELHALRSEMRRKAISAPLMMIVEDDTDELADYASD